jgi:hypothetical protein
MAALIIKSGTTAIAGATVKGSFSYFSGSTKDLGPTSSTGFYQGTDAPDGGYVVYQIGGPSGVTERVATDTTSLNSILISAGGTGSTANQNITWATNTDSVFINSGVTITYTLGQTAFGGRVAAINGNELTILNLTNTDFYPGPGAAPWGCNGTAITGLGTSGLNNQNTILAQCATRPIYFSYVSGVAVNGYSDWFVPSQSEITTIINGLVAAGKFNYNFQLFGPYWTSTQSTTADTTNAIAYDWNTTPLVITDVSKTNYNNVRAIRIQIT